MRRRYVRFMQQTRFIGYRGVEQYLQMEMDLPYVDANAHEWVVELLPESTFRLWRRFDDVREHGVVSYLPDSTCDEGELISAGYAGCRRVKHSDTVL